MKISEIRKAFGGKLLGQNKLKQSVFEVLSEMPDGHIILGHRNSILTNQSKA